MITIPFLRPNLVPLSSYVGYLKQMDERRLYSNYGPLNSQFETRVINEVFNGLGACVTVGNATLGLMLAISCSKRRGRYAVMPSFTFAAAPQAARWCGLEPYFVDIDPASWSMSVEAVDHAIRALGDDVAVVMPYATFGTAFDLDWYEGLIADGVPVVIDAAASFGCQDSGRTFGASFSGTIVYSFHATKAFCVGEGGLVYSGSPGLIQRIRRAANFGFGSEREALELGLNAKSSEYVAAIALATLDVFASKTDIRGQIYSRYTTELESTGALDAGFELQMTRGINAHQFFPILSPPDRDSKEIVMTLERAGVQARTYFSPACHQQPVFRSSPSGPLPVTETVASRILSLPLFEEMTEAETTYVVRSLTP